MVNAFWSGLFMVILCFSSLMCTPSRYTNRSSHFVLDEIIRSDTSVLAKYASDPRYKVQIRYTRIDRDKDNQPHFQEEFYQIDDDHYFYPASTVKMPIAFLAAQKCRQLGISLSSVMLTDSVSAGQSAVLSDPTASGGLPSVSHYIKKIFLVSDNDASNRLYEFLGQDYIHRELRRIGLERTEIVHRLSIFLSEEQNRRTNPVRFLSTSGQLLFQQPEQYSLRNYPSRQDQVGKGFVQDGKLIEGPMDFSKKNRMTLSEMHHLMQLVMFPEKFNIDKRFDLTEEDYRYLYQCMSQLPGESSYPAYDTSSFYDAYVKFFMYGTKKHVKIPAHIRIFNKVGWSYGFLTDVAYIVDFENRVEFFLSATIYCNEDEILNDDQYDYERIGLPFLEKLGEGVYKYELARKRKIVPDLSKFRMNYR